MKKLLDGQIENFPNVWGFVDASLDAIFDAYRDGRIDRPIEPKERFMSLEGDLAALLQQQGDPCDYGYLLVATQSRWTAVFNNSFSGPLSTVRYFARKVPCTGLIVACVDHTFDPATKTGQHGMVAFCHYARGYDPSDTRDVSVVYDGDEIESFHWQFEQSGEPLPFEHVERYTAPDVRDRFTWEILEEYCRALDIDLFNETFYGPGAVLVY